ncbi:ScbA/BarX family gamma-butyrolactone biosynthesis protein [Streptomyces sp. NPDC003327]
MDRNRRGTSTSVPGEFVHRADPADIIPTGWSQIQENRFSISARWPAVHSYFSPVAGRRHDPVLVAETLRQATMLVAHAELGVSVDHQFVMWDLFYSADPAALELNGASSDIVVDLAFSEVRGQGRGLRADGVLTRDGRPLATGGGRISCTSPAAYRRIRGARMAALGAPVPLIAGVEPSLVGREHSRDVALGPGTRAGQWQLRINTAHSTLFRRPNDHVPGMLLLEAARQAATATVGGAFVPTSMDVSFSRYVELDSPCWIEAEPVPGPGPGVTAVDPDVTVVRVVGHQDGETVFTCVLTSPSRDLAAAGARAGRRLAS